MEKITWLEKCEACGKITIHSVVDHIDGYESVGMLGSDKVECEEC